MIKACLVITGSVKKTSFHLSPALQSLLYSKNRDSEGNMYLYVIY